MEESRKDRHYHPTTTTTTTGKERKEKEKETRISCVTTVESQDIRVTSAGGTKEDRSTTWINPHQCGHYQMTTQHRIYNLQSATTTILTQPQQQPPSITPYDQQQYVRAVAGATL
eukprot:4533052-Amphidinium_carterae.1